MDNNLMNLDLFDLISQRHQQVRNEITERWQSEHQTIITNSEWQLIVRIAEYELSIASICKQIQISRQATHKLLRNLEGKGLVTIFALPNNKKDLFVKLTQEGLICLQEQKKIKIELLEKISGILGEPVFNGLMKAMRTDWELSK